MQQFFTLNTYFYPFGDSIFQLLIMEPNSSTPLIPPLPFASLDNRNTPKSQSELKQRIKCRMSVTDIIQLPTISEEGTERLLSTDRSSMSIGQVRTLKALKISALREMTEEECMARYSKDPFFRKKVQSQVKSLTKTASYSQMPKNTPIESELHIPSTTKLIEQQKDTTLRKVMESECKQSILSIRKLKEIIKRVQSGAKQNDYS